jgi:hypothetical protein
VLACGETLGSGYGIGCSQRLLLDGEEAAAERRREREELDRRLKGTKWELIFVKFLPIVVDEHSEDADEKRKPTHDEEDSPVVAPE